MMSNQVLNQVRWKRRFSAEVLPRVILILMSLLFSLPFYQMIVTSFKGSAELSVFPPTLWPRDPIWRNYYDAVRYIPFLRYFINSAVLTAGAAVGAVLSNAMIAYGFARIPWKGRDILFYIAVATVFIPFPVTLVALFDIFARLGWINTYLPLIVPAFFGAPFYMFLIRQFLMGLSRDLSDSARIDGAGEWLIFARIIMPLMKSALAVVAIFAAVGAWNDFLGPLIYLQTENRYPLSIGLQFFRSEYDIAYSLLMAASTLVVLPVVAVFIAFQRCFVEGITVGAIKG